MASQGKGIIEHRMVMLSDVEQALNHMDSQHREAVMSIITMQQSVIVRTPHSLIILVKC